MKKLIRIDAVQDYTGCGRSKIYKMMSEGTFPRPVKIDGCSAWVEGEVSKWIDARIAESRA